jgi:hypothetical protein
MLLRGRYRVLRRLPWNGLALVYLCERQVDDDAPDAGQRVAVALLPLDGQRCPEVVPPFLRQAELVAAIDDPHVVPVTDHGVVDGVPFFELRYENAPTLAEVLASPEDMARIDRDRALDIVRQLLRGLVSLHAHGVCHWDLTPSNVLLAIDTHGWDQIRIVGAGIGTVVRKAPAAATADTGSRGSGPLAERYLAPEILQGGGPVDRRADLHAAGVLLRHLLEGTLPAPGARLGGALAGDPGLAAVVARATATDPGERFASARGMMTALQDPSWETEGESEPTLQIETLRELDAGGRDDGSLAPVATAGGRPSQAPKRGGMGGRWAATLLAGAALTAGIASAAAAGVLFSGSGPASVGELLGNTADAPAGAAAGPARAPVDPASLAEVSAAAPVAEADPQNAPDAQAEPAGAAAAPTAPDHAVGETTPTPTPPEMAFAVDEATAPDRVDPLAGTLPEGLAPFHAEVAAGGKLSRAQIDDLFGWVNRHKDDVRGHLVLAHAFMNLGWRSDALDRYRYAGRVDARRAAQDRKLLPDLMELLRYDELSPDAALAIREIVGPDALPLVRTAYETEPRWTIRRRLQILGRRLEALQADAE